MLNSFPSMARSLRSLAIATVIALAPAAASAATMSLSLLDPDGSGFGANILLDDGATPGSLTIELESTSPLAAPGPIGDLLSFVVEYDSDVLSPDLDATGADVEETSILPGGPDNLLVNLGAGSLFTLNGISSTQVVLSHPTETVDLAALEGATLTVVLGFDAALAGAPGFSFDDRVNAIKVRGTILPIIPEPSTALLMMMGLSGLAVAGGKRRV